MKRRRIVFVNRYFYPDISATSQLVSDLAFHLADEGVSVVVVTSRQEYNNAKARLLAHQIINRVQVRRVWSSTFGRHNLIGRALDYLTFYMASAWRLWRLVRPGDIVVAKTDPPLISVVAARVGRRRNAILVNWVQDLFPEVASALRVRGMNGWLATQLRRARNASLRFARINIAVGDGMAVRIRNEGIPKNRIKVIHNWADGQTIRPQEAAANPLRKEWGLSNRFVVGYSGNMGRAHEFGTILDAAELLNDEERIVFLFIGDGAQWPWIEKTVQAKRLHNFLFKPHQPRERLGQSLSVPDVHLASLRPEVEGFVVPSKFYGAAAAGRPVFYIGDPSGEIATIIRDVGCGVAIPVGDATALAAEIRHLDSDRDLCWDMGRKARLVLEHRFDRPKALSAWKQLLSSI